MASRGNIELSLSARSRVASRRASELQLHGFDGNQLADFISRLQSVVKHKDAKALSGMVKYPLLVNLQGRSIKVLGPRQLSDAYEQVMTPRVRQEIENANICNVAAVRQAAAIGGDVVWIKNLNGLGIVTINVPGPDARAFFAGGCQGDAVDQDAGCIAECK